MVFSFFFFCLAFRVFRDSLNAAEVGERKRGKKKNRESEEKETKKKKGNRYGNLKRK